MPFTAVHSDDAPDHARQHLQEIQGDKFQPILAAHSSTATYLVPPYTSASVASTPVEYPDNNSLWEDLLLTRKLRFGMRVSLQAFYLFEWFPRSPGLYYTGPARFARSEARARILSLEDGTLVYDPYGKMSMLDGGIGNIRLRPVVVNNEEFMMMSASSNGSCHEGFPIALPVSLYGTVIDEIRARGSVVRTLVGELKLVPDSLTQVYAGYERVPKIYLKVDRLDAPRISRSRRLEEFRVSVAVSFISEYEGSSKIYACYVSFDPGLPQDFDRAVEWMEQDYVGRRYKGRVLTDFDDQENHFANATFSLRKVMTLSLVERDFGAAGSGIHIDSVVAGNLILNQAAIEEVSVGSKYVITGGTQGAVGDGATGFVSQQNLNVLANELSRLARAARDRAASPEQQRAVAEIDEAEKAARAGKESTVLEKLKAAGKWALDVATEIGTSVAAEIIKHQIGLS